MKKNRGNSANKNKEKGKDKNEPKITGPDTKRLPGDYPADEDIMNPTAGMERVHIDPSNLSTSRKTTEDLVREQLEDSSSQPPAHNTDSDLSKEDYEALGPRDLSLDDSDDEQLKHRPWPVDFAARDLDVPGSELDDRSENIGSEDEENNSYSLGSERNDNLEDDSSK